MILNCSFSPMANAARVLLSFATISMTHVVFLHSFFLHFSYWPNLLSTRSLEWQSKSNIMNNQETFVHHDKMKEKCCREIKCWWMDMDPFLFALLRFKPCYYKPLDDSSYKKNINNTTILENREYWVKTVMCPLTVSDFECLYEKSKRTNNT